MIAQYVSDLWTQFYDPFYGWVFLGFLIAAFSTWTAMFFPVLRSLAGAVFFGVVAFLVGMRKGQHVERDRNAARERNTERHRW